MGRPITTNSPKAVYNRAWYAANRDAVKEKVRKWRAANPEWSAELSRAAYLRNYDHSRQTKRRYYLRVGYLRKMNRAVDRQIERFQNAYPD